MPAPTKGQRKDALILSDMILDAMAKKKQLPEITDERLWLLAATLRYIVKRHKASIID